MPRKYVEQSAIHRDLQPWLCVECLPSQSPRVFFEARWEKEKRGWQRNESAGDISGFVSAGGVAWSQVI